MNDNKRFWFFVILFFGVLIYASIAWGQEEKSQPEYIVPFVVEDEKQNFNNEDFCKQFMIKKLRFTSQKPGDALDVRTLSIQDDGTNVIIWIKTEDGSIYGIELSTYPLTDDQ